MHVIRRRGWEIPEHHATPEHLFLDRRAFLAAGGAAAIALSPLVIVIVVQVLRMAGLYDSSSAWFIW